MVHRTGIAPLLSYFFVSWSSLSPLKSNNSDKNIYKGQLHREEGWIILNSVGFRSEFYN